MSWSYSGSPSDSTLDEVRFLVGQTSTGDDVRLEDEEITYTLANQPNTYYAAALCAENLQARYALEADDMAVGQTRVAFKDRASGFSRLAATLRQKALLAGVSPYVGGVSVSAKDTQEEDTDWVQPFATLEDMDNEGQEYST